MQVHLQFYACWLSYGAKTCIFFFNEYRREAMMFTIYIYHLCDRFLHGSPKMASISGVKGEELGKPDMRPLNDPSATDFIISLGEHCHFPEA
jgi:hypothetical protein